MVDPKRQPAPQPLKLLVATVGFMICMSIAMLWALHHEVPLPQYPEGRAQNSPPEVFFYATIGDSPAPPQLVAQQPQDAGYVVELGTRFTMAEAEQAVGALKDKGVDAYYSPFHHKGRVYFRIRTGNVGLQPETEALASRIRRDHKIVAQVVQF